MSGYTGTSYEEAAASLGKRSSLVIRGTATTLERRSDDIIAVRYHSTDVVTYHANGDIVLDSGGWWTSTTKKRINRYLPLSMYVTQRDFEWFVFAAGVEVPFVDGFTVKA